jgi:hypothetical protein
VIVPGRHVDPAYAELLAGRQSMAEFVAAADSRVDPVTDDRPFFFARQKPWGLPSSMALAFSTILLPIAVLCAWFVARGRPSGVGGPAFASSVVYFAGLGLGFIAVELALLQHLTLLLGHPIFTLSILLFTLLLFGGLGSSRSARVDPRVVCLVVAGLGTLYALLLPRLVPVLLPLGFEARLAVAVALAAPLGFAMGMPFPRGLALASKAGLPAPPFYWGLNGILSVAGSLGTMVLAVTSGFTVAMLAGCACYLVAALAARGVVSAAAA